MTDEQRPDRAGDEEELIATTGREHRRGSFGPGGGVGMPAERTENFTTVLRRLGEILGRERAKLLAVAALTLASVTLVVTAS
jgi:ATP-binding cassette subfamily B protein